MQGKVRTVRGSNTNVWRDKCLTLETFNIQDDYESRYTHELHPISAKTCFSLTGDLVCSENPVIAPFISLKLSRSEEDANKRRKGNTRSSAKRRRLSSLVCSSVDFQLKGERRKEIQCCGVGLNQSRSISAFSTTYD